MCAKRWVFATAPTSSTRALCWRRDVPMTSSPTSRYAGSIWANTSVCERMKQSLQLRTSQHLALTPQLQQSIRLLQLSTLELHQELEQLLTDNPLLERLDDPLDRSLRLLSDGALSSTATPAEAPPQPPSQETPAAPAETDGYDGDAGEGRPRRTAGTTTGAKRAGARRPRMTMRARN